MSIMRRSSQIITINKVAVCSFTVHSTVFRYAMITHHLSWYHAWNWAALSALFASHFRLVLLHSLISHRIYRADTWSITIVIYATLFVIGLRKICSNIDAKTNNFINNLIIYLLTRRWRFRSTIPHSRSHEFHVFVLRQSFRLFCSLLDLWWYT